MSKQLAVILRIADMYKVCKVHGELTSKNIITIKRNYTLKKTGEKSDKYQHTCRLCQYKRLSEWQKRNKDKRKASIEKYLLNNADRVKEIRKKSYDKHRDKRIALSKKINQREHVKKYRTEYTKKGIERASDEYIKKVLIGKSNIKIQDLSPELIEAKRALILMKRLLKLQGETT